MLFAIDAVPLPTGEHVTTLGTIGVLITGLIAWILKSALPTLLNRFLVELEKREERYEKTLAQHRDERAAMDARHTDELARRDETCRQAAQTAAAAAAAITVLSTKLEILLADSKTT